MTKLVVILGSVTPPGRFSLVLETALAEAQSAHPGLETKLLDLAAYRIAFADGRPAAQLGDDTERLQQLVHEADAVLLASPVYRASFTGCLKNLLDHLPVEALAGKPCGIAAMGATLHHYLGAERHLRDVLAWFGALTAPTSVYLSSADFENGVPTTSAVTELGALLGTLLRLSRAVASIGPLEPAPLAARRA